MTNNETQMQPVYIAILVIGFNTMTIPTITIAKKQSILEYG